MIGPVSRRKRELDPLAGWASLYLARDERLGRPVALKLLAGHLGGNDAGARARFRAGAGSIRARSSRTSAHL
ncbi:MAG: hypothetical protein R3E12_14765 [Candidatus Eisenbacteria bacterium]